MLFCFFFFFQAEDGIRDFHVTGVQTCALPISGRLETHVDVGLGPVLDRYERARSQAETLLAVAASGLLACALANLGLLGALAYDRRRTETGLSWRRGASPGSRSTSV